MYEPQLQSTDLLKKQNGFHRQIEPPIPYVQNKIEEAAALLSVINVSLDELNQPMMTISGHSELLMDTLDPNDPIYLKIAKIKSQVERMGAITQKLMGITRYETKDYVQGERIVDMARQDLAETP